MDHIPNFVPDPPSSIIDYAEEEAYKKSKEAYYQSLINKLQSRLAANNKICLITTAYVSGPELNNLTAEPYLRSQIPTAHQTAIDMFISELRVRNYPVVYSKKSKFHDLDINPRTDYWMEIEIKLK